MPTTPVLITALPTPPSTSSPSDFDTKADTFLGALPVHTTETNALSTTNYNNAVEAYNSSVTATTQAGIATTGASTATTQAGIATSAAVSAAASAATASSAVAFLDTNPVVKGSSDPTKQIRFEVDGLSSATTRVLTVQDKDGTVAMTSDITGGTLAGSFTTLTVPQIVFPATQVPSASANTLDDYEEGTWTPTDASGAGLVFPAATGTYTKIGRIVFCTCNITFPTTASTVGAAIDGLPFTSGAYGGNSIMGTYSLTSATITTKGVYGGAGVSYFVFDKNNGSAVAQNVDFSAKVSYIFLIYQV